MARAKTENLISILNAKIQGWAHHYRRVVAKETFALIDREIFVATWKSAKKRHGKKSAKWVQKKYFTRLGSKQSCFYAKTIEPDKAKVSCPVPKRVSRDSTAFLSDKCLPKTNVFKHKI